MPGINREDTPLIPGALLVRKADFTSGTTSVYTRTIMRIMGVRPNEGSLRYDDSVVTYAWVLHNGELSTPDIARVSSLYAWASDNHVDFLYHLCTNRLGDFPRKPAEEVEI